MDFKEEIVQFMTDKVGGITIVAEGSAEIVYADSYFRKKYGDAVVLYGMTIARHWKLTGMLLNGNILTQTQKNISNSIPDFFKKKEKIIRYTRLPTSRNIWD